MKRLIGLSAAALLLAGMLSPASAGPGPDGITSDNVEHVAFVPFEVGTATGARVIGKFLYVTTWRSFSIYDISDPEAPVRLSTTPFAGQDGEPSPIKFENEDVATNGKVMIFSEELPQATLHVFDVEDKTNPVQISTLAGAGQHTMSCILDCKWLYGSDGAIIDLRDPTKPVLMKEKWGDGMPATGGHDVIEYKPGFAMTSSNPILILDVRNPIKPKLLATSQEQEFIHSAQWPREGKDRWALTSGETWVGGVDSRCDESSAGVSTWDTTGWGKTKTFKKVDTYRMKGGTYTDGNPVINAPFGCSSHWFQQHPNFNNQGLIAAGYYNHGTRFLNVDSKGKISEVGFFLPNAGGTSGAYWITDRLVYAIDYQRGFDILKWNGKI
ncbi:MAG: hypothetical protein QOG54_465 [Actinomycetota bacterium]|jgi:hypothetical protein|nr:hypothetical protein [Actinomycetota bacterium]